MSKLAYTLPKCNECFTVVHFRQINTDLIPYELHLSVQ